MWCLFWYGFLLSSTVLTSPFWDKKKPPFSLISLSQEEYLPEEFPLSLGKSCEKSFSFCLSLVSSSLPAYLWGLLCPPFWGPLPRQPLKGCAACPALVLSPLHPAWHCLLSVEGRVPPRPALGDCMQGAHLAQGETSKLPFCLGGAWRWPLGCFAVWTGPLPPRVLSTTLAPAVPRKWHLSFKEAAWV